MNRENFHRWMEKYRMSGKFSLGAAGVNVREREKEDKLTKGTGLPPVLVGVQTSVELSFNNHAVSSQPDTHVSTQRTRRRISRFFSGGGDSGVDDGDLTVVAGAKTVFVFVFVLAGVVGADVGYSNDNHTVQRPPKDEEKSSPASAAVDVPTTLSLTTFFLARRPSMKSALTPFPPWPTLFTSPFTSESIPLQICDERRPVGSKARPRRRRIFRRGKRARMTEERDPKSLLASAVSQYWILLEADLQKLAEVWICSWT
ncbi:hypothetical protein EDC04DRAFT_2896170 [Pisolithus marmoratus]|nr:hypothetical protein EDC04DRAFT_2896170 [Pisolithus marmoratus]